MGCGEMSGELSHKESLLISPVKEFWGGISDLRCGPLLKGTATRKPPLGMV